MISPDTGQLEIGGNYGRYVQTVSNHTSGFFGATEVVVFDDPEHWVEDEDYVTAERPCISWVWVNIGTDKSWLGQRFSCDL